MVRKNEYVDKTGLISLINDSIETNRKLTCVSRPRRFGKSTAAKMLCAYYDCSCDSSILFDDLEIALKPGLNANYKAHLNNYNVLFLDISSFKPMINAGKTILEAIRETVVDEIKDMFPNVRISTGIDDTLVRVVEYTGRKFIAIIDEWDMLIRDDKISEPEKTDYLEFLRSLFKSSNITDRVFAAAYITGILPIRKDGSQSAISEFKEYTMLKPEKFAPYVGFNEPEVKDLCEKHGTDFSKMKTWYDGYMVGSESDIYNPNSVMEAIRQNKFESYWSASSSAESLIELINLDYDGLQDTVVSLIGGNEEQISTRRFKNDINSYSSKDDVLTLLVHFGYFSYDGEKSTIRIPNEEIKAEFADAVHDIKDTRTMQRVKESRELIDLTVAKDETRVAEIIERIHREETHPLFYNNEQSLRSVIKLAYFAYRDEYLQFEELPSGDGFIDIVYFPRKASLYPILVIELKYKDSPESAINQIKRNHYPERVRDYGAEILLVGISYDKDTRKHSCRIETG